jgi:hypothetical protein
VRLFAHSSPKLLLRAHRCRDILSDPQASACEQGIAADVTWRLDMLALSFSDSDFAFIYSDGRPIGALLLGEIKGAGRVKLRFAGDTIAFEVLRPSVVERRFGKAELVKLTERFLSAE